MGSCAAPSAKGDDKFITTDYLQQCQKKVREDIAWLVECDYDGKVLDNNEYSLIFTYSDEADLKEQIDELFDEIYRTAEIRNCVVDDMTLTNDATNQGWNEYDGGWQ